MQKPYLLFVGEAPDSHAAKTAAGIKYWRPDDCVGQWRANASAYDIGLPDMSFKEAVQKGAETLVVGLAPTGGAVPDHWVGWFEEALEAGLDLAAGLHHRLNDIERLRLLAISRGRKIYDIRQPQVKLPIGTGKKRSGKRLLAVGVDCAVGKMYTALALERDMKKRGVKADFRATGQTGIFIAGQGICVDAVISDFVAGAAELLSPDNDADHWDIIEGQGSLFHPGYAAVTLGLLHGSQPDAFVVCHDPSRPTIDEYPHVLTTSLERCIQVNIEMGRLTNPNIQCVGVAANTSKMGTDEALSYLDNVSKRIGLPCVDPVRTGVSAIIDEMEL